MNTVQGISRRRFFELAGGGVVVLVCLGSGAALAQDAQHIYPQDFNAYLVVGKNGEVTVFSGKIEMGQGVLTSQAQMVAEELAVPLASIRMVLGDTDRCPVDMGTFGSLTTRMFGPVLRAAASRARTALLALAATKLGVTPQDLTVVDGIVSVIGKPDRQVSYAELSQGARIAEIVDSAAVLRDPGNFRVMGTSPKRLDGADKVTGVALYAADVRLPGMLYARILRPPRHGAALTRVDTAGAARLPGITLVHRGDLVAVLHADPQAADAGLAHIKAEWSTAESGLDSDTIFEHIVAHSGMFRTLLDRGDVAGGRGQSGKSFEAKYQKGYVAHGAMEPHAALAEVAAGKATVWASTQTPFPTRDRVAKELGLDVKDVRVITPYLGGGFGGKSADGQAIEAAVLAQITGKPVQVAWTRAEEFFCDTFDPASVVTISSGLDASARISFWEQMVYAAGDRAAVPCYDAPNILVRTKGGLTYGTAPAQSSPSVHPFAVGPWRAPGANMNVFAIESQIDYMAAAAGMDPLAFRLHNLTDPRMRRVLQAAADAFGWREAVAPSKRGFGIACNIDAGTYVAAMAEVKVDPSDGRVQVVRVVCAQDMGVIVNPEGATMQIEGGITMGLGYALSEELHFMGGDIRDRNFDTYEIPRFSWVPKIDVVLVRNDAVAPQGGGEPPITTTGAVLANAIFDATGARLYRLPMTAERVRTAITALVPRHL